MLAAALLLLDIAAGGSRLLWAQTAAKPAPAAKSAEASKPKAEEPQDEVVDIEAERMDEDVDAGTTTFTGNVRITRETGYLYADKVTLFRDVGGADSSVQRTLAAGNVRMKDDDMVATSETAEFRDGNNIIDLQGTKKSPAVVLQGEDRYEAERFVYDRRTGKRTASGGVKLRVRVKRTEAPAESAASTENGAAAPSNP